jgi:STE24 endopeptidase
MPPLAPTAFANRPHPFPAHGRVPILAPFLVPMLAPVFVLTFLLHLALKLWLSTRQMQYVAQRADAVPPPFAHAIGLADHRRAAQYTIAKQRLVVVETLLGAAIFLLLTWGGGLQRLYDALGPLAGNGIAFDAALVVAVTLILGAADLPIEWYRCFGIEQRFGFNRMTPALFVADVLKSALLGAILGLPLLLAVLALMRAGGAAWWLWAWMVWAAFSLALSVLYPLLIAPVFNRFTPLSCESLRRRIGDLLRRTGFRDNGVYTMDGSRRSSHGNAYFTGLGAAKRIVFYDTLVERLHPDEIEAVLAHELGHFRLHHVAKRIVAGLALTLAGMALLGWLLTQDWFALSLGVEARAGLPGNGLTLVLLALVLPRFTFLLAPLQSALSRRHEFEADAFAARHASAQSLVHALVKLYQDNAATLTPDPVHSVFYDSHPPASIRIDRLLAGAPAAAAS